MSPRARPDRLGITLRILAVLMAVWEPLTLAAVASSSLARFATFGAPAFLLLALRAMVAGLGIAAGRAIWTAAPGGLALARVWLGLSSLATVLTFVTPYFPSNRLPGTKWWTLGGVLALNALWLAYLSCSARVRRLFAS